MQFSKMFALETSIVFCASDICMTICVCIIKIKLKPSFYNNLRPFFVCNKKIYKFFFSVKIKFAQILNPKFGQQKKLHL